MRGTGFTFQSDFNPANKRDELKAYQDTIQIRVLGVSAFKKRSCYNAAYVSESLIELLCRNEFWGDVAILFSLPFLPSLALWMQSNIKDTNYRHLG